MSDKEHDQAGHDASHEHGEVYPYTPHHFHEAQQHFDSGKMGVWLFLVTEILFFAGLFCAYTIFRGLHPEIFYWAHFYLDTFWGALNTVVLILSSFTAAWAVRNAQLGEKKLLKMNIVITIVGALIFMGVKSVEYSHKFHDGLLPAAHFEPKHEVWETPSFKEQHPESAAAAEDIIAGLEARKNKQAAVRDEVIHRNDALALVPVQNNGDAALAPVSKTAVAPTAAPAAEAAADAKAEESKAADAEEKIAEAGEGSMVGILKADAAQEAEKAAEAEAAPEKVAAAKAPAAPELTDDEWLSRKIAALTYEERHPLDRAGVIRDSGGGPVEFARPDKAGIFFSIYFFMTGLHGFHVVVGIGLWIWMLTIVNRRKMGKKYFGPIEFTALYWHLVDLIWIYLFPMLYLIH